MEDYKVVKAVTLPFLKMVCEQQYFVTIKSEIFKSKGMMDKAGAAKGSKAEKMEPADVVRVIDLEDPKAGEKEMIVNSVLKSTLDENYPANAYVGKSFLLVKHNKTEGKAYHRFTVTEIAPKGGAK